MTDFTKVLTEMPLSFGAHGADEGKACVMEKVAILWALHSGQDVAAVFSDLPDCTNHVVARVAQTVNDGLDDDERQQLNAFIPRLLRARQTPSDHRVNVRLAIWAARQTLHLVLDKNRPPAEAAVAAAQRWLDDPTEELRRRQRRRRRGRRRRRNPRRLLYVRRREHRVPRRATRPMGGSRHQRGRRPLYPPVMGRRCLGFLR